MAEYIEREATVKLLRSLGSRDYRREKGTIQEAIKILTELKPIPVDGFKIIAEAYDLAIEALEKQIPKKPLHMHKNYYCPICKEDGWMMWDDAVPNDMDKYCGMCGQAIDWSDDE